MISSHNVFLTNSIFISYLQFEESVIYLNVNNYFSKLVAPNNFVS